jgi:dipeptidyl-peptidase 4
MTDLVSLRFPFPAIVAWLRVMAIGGLLAAGVAPVRGQGTPADYERAAKFGAWTRNKVFRSAVVPHWSEDGNRFWYRNDLAEDEREFIVVDAVKGTRQLAFDHAKLAAALGKIRKADVAPKHLPVDRLTLDPAGHWLRFDAFGKRYELKSATGELSEAANEKPASSLPMLDKIRPTQRTGEAARIVFVNARNAPLELFWIDAEGRRVSYGALAAGQESVMQTFAGHVWLVADSKKGTLGIFEAAEGGGRVVLSADLKFQPSEAAPKRPSGNASPDGKWIASFKGRNLILVEKSTKKEIVLTRDGTADDGYEGPVFWSPDSSRLVAMRTVKGDDRKVNLIESSPKDSIYPKLHTLSYAKPGDKLTISKPRLFDAQTLEAIPVSDDLFRDPWSITQPHWDRAGKEFVFLFNQRGHQALRLVGIDGATGKTRAIIDETSRTFVDYAGKFFLQEIEETGEILWMSERGGWNHLYLIDQATGAVKNPITHGEWVVRGVDRVDAKKRQIWFRAGGIHAKQDPYHVHHCRVDFDGTGLVILTQGDGNHAVRPSPDGRFLLDTYSRVDLPPVTELRRADDGSLVCALEQGDMSLLVKAGWQVPERFTAKGRDGTTDIYGVIYRPTNFDPAKKYPVIEAIYAGPHGSFVPKEFRAHHRPQEMAELGFIVVQIDGMGTSNRSKAFHDVCWKNLGDSGFPDRILWIRAAARTHPSMDIRRVGIYGGSAGGQSALRALLAHGDFYYVAVADCGCHDNRIDKIWWNELWMGYPLGPQYQEQSNVANAHKLTGRLLLTVGELDRNVDPASTMQVVNALIKAGKDFDLLVVPGAGHGVGETPYAARRRQDFFVRHLLGVAPPERNGRPEDVAQ